MAKMDLDKIIQEINKRKLTAYEISKNTPLSEDGINKILSGASKNPRKTTLLILHDYLFKEEAKQEKPPEREPYSFEDAVAEKVANRVLEELRPYITRSRDLVLKAIANIQLDMEELHTDQEELKQMQQEAKEVLDDSQKSLKVLEGRGS